MLRRNQRREPPRLRVSLLAAAACAALGCGGGSDTAPNDPPFNYPLDDVLRINHVQVKATHNSYHIEPEGNIYDPWGYTHAPLDEQLSIQGVRGFELDINYNFALGTFRVFHEPPDRETTCGLFVDCLAILKGWSDAHPAHVPLFVQIEAKDDFGALDPDTYREALEGEILSVWPADRIVTPALVQGSAPDLRSALAGEGWPALGRVRGRIFFTLLWTGEANAHYALGGKSLKDRLFFLNSRPSDAFGAVAILDDPIAEAQVLDESLKAGLLVRTRADADNVEPLAGDAARVEATLAVGAHYVTTDYPAKVFGVDYSVEIPGGTPARCNPRTAPAQCTPEAIEDPAFIDIKGEAN